MTRIIAPLVGCLLSLAAYADPVIGGPEVGWTLDFGAVTPEQKKAFGWFNDEVKKKFTKFSNTYAAPDQEPWQMAGKVVALHGVSGPALWSITELLNGSTVEEVKKVHYRTMSEAKGW